MDAPFRSSLSSSPQRSSHRYSSSDPSPPIPPSKLGNNLGPGAPNSSITRYSPWTCPVPVFNPDTSYGRNFNPDHGEHHKIHLLQKRQALDCPHVYQATKDHKPKVAALAQAQKDIRTLADRLTADAIKFPRSLAPVEWNKKLKVDERDITVPNQHRQEHHPRITRLSLGNEEWLRAVERRRVARMVTSGEFIPSVDQMQLYGRKEVPTK